MAEPLRVVDLGLVSAPRSQALFHGIASAMHEGDAPVLTLVSPAQPYVCIGMHQDVVAEVDEAYCRDAGLPVLRRHVGGGAVYLDRNQLFFHFIYPVHKAPRRVTDLYAHFVAPVLATYQAFGIHARLRPINDIHVNDRKIGGTGAAQIGDATIFVGSFLLDFDVETMACCLKVPSEKFRDKLRGTLQDYITTMRRELGAIPPREALVARFLLDVGEHLRVEPRHGELRDDEIRAVDEWERQLQEPDWLYQPNRRRFADGVKITGGVHLGEAMHKARGGLVRVRLLSQNQRIVDVEISGDFTCIPASGVDALAHALRGLDLASADMTARIAQHMTTLGLDLPGVAAEDIASAIRGACAQGD